MLIVFKRSYREEITMDSSYRNGHFNDIESHVN